MFKHLNLVVPQLCNLQQSRFISRNAVLLAKNYYDMLGITPKATQSDIKKAYYKLSMMYHPDKNKGSEEAGTKFREITEAYEILGSYKSRRLYDRGMIHRKSHQDYDRQEDVEDDPQTKFYKQHMRRSEPPTSGGGSTPIYDFDEWSRAHYGTTFERKVRAKKRYEKLKDESKAKYTKHVEYTVVGLFLIVCMMILYTQSLDRGYDNVAEDKKTKNS